MIVKGQWQGSYLSIYYLKLSLRAAICPFYRHKVRNLDKFGSRGWNSWYILLYYSSLPLCFFISLYKVKVLHSLVLFSTSKKWLSGPKWSHGLRLGFMFLFAFVLCFFAPLGLGSCFGLQLCKAATSIAGEIKPLKQTRHHEIKQSFINVDDVLLIKGEISSQKLQRSLMFWEREVPAQVRFKASICGYGVDRG